MKKIYLDYSATTPVDKRVIEAMMPYFNNRFGNASSIHSFGQVAAEAESRARVQAAKFLNCQPNEIVFTSGATESNNLAIKGLLKNIIENSRNNKKYHIITSVIEHDSVLEPFVELEKQGVEVTHLPVDNRGVIKLDALKESFKKNTVLVSVMYVNSEVGSIQPIGRIGSIIRKINNRRLRDWDKIDKKDRGEKPELVYFHSDATQAANYLDCDTKINNLDMLSLSAHKIYGPKGVGLLYLKSGTPLSPLIIGGHHQNNLRSGTLNIPGIVGLGAALEQLTDKKQKEKNDKKISTLRDFLVDKVIKNIPEVVLNTERKNSTPAHAHFSFLGVEGESILISLDLEGVAVSTGSACASNTLKASHVLIAMGIDKEVAHNSIRFSLGRKNTKEEIEIVAKKLKEIIERLRDISPV